MQTTDIQPFYLIGNYVKTSNQDITKLTADIQGLWERFFSGNISGRIPNRVDSSICCIYTDYLGDYAQPYTAVLGCRVHDLSAIPNGMMGFHFTGGKYQKMQTTTPLVFNKWQEIWQSDIQRAYTADFEVYDENAADPKNAPVDIFVALKI